MGAAIEAMKDRKGTLQAPAKTCKHLAHLHQDYESGIGLTLTLALTIKFSITLKQNHLPSRFLQTLCLNS